MGAPQSRFRRSAFCQQSHEAERVALAHVEDHVHRIDPIGNGAYLGHQLAQLIIGVVVVEPVQCSLPLNVPGLFVAPMKAQDRLSGAGDLPSKHTVWLAAQRGLH